MKSYFSRPLIAIAFLAIALTLLLGVNGLATGRTSAQTAPGDDTRTGALDRVEKVLNHFKCWTAQGESASRIAYLQDQFDTTANAAGQTSSGYETVRVDEPRVFCNPARKIHGTDSAGINDVNHHLTCYGIEALDPFEPRVVDVLNQFGTGRLQVLRPIGLCAPTQKLLVNGDKPQFGGDAPKGLDHFKCYEVAGQPLDEEVRIQDQFDRLRGADHFEDVFLLDPLMLCNPVKKAVFRGFVSPVLTASSGRLEVTPVRYPDAHLVCYRLTPPETLAAELVVRNQFGPEQQLVALASEMLCVPSLKREVRTPGV